MILNVHPLETAAGISAVRQVIHDAASGLSLEFIRSAFYKGEPKNPQHVANFEALVEDFSHRLAHDESFRTGFEHYRQSLARKAEPNTLERIRTFLTGTELERLASGFIAKSIDSPTPGIRYEL